MIAVASATLHTPSGPVQGISRSRLTAVFTQQGGRWKVSAFHNALVREAA